jgi:hypothetical protein
LNRFTEVLPASGCVLASVDASLANDVALPAAEGEGEMKTQTDRPSARGIDNEGARGAWLRGEAPRELVLSDGTRLALAPAASGAIEWQRHDGLEGETRLLSAREAEELAGEWAAYVAVRTRSETEWLRTLAQWCEGEASRLEGELGHCRA